MRKKFLLKRKANLVSFVGFRAKKIIGRALKYELFVSRADCFRDKNVFSVTKRYISLRNCEIKTWQDYECCILLVQRNVLMLEHFRKEYDVSFLFSKLYWKKFQQCFDPCLFCVLGKNFGEKCFFFVMKVCFSITVL